MKNSSVRNLNFKMEMTMKVKYSFLFAAALVATGFIATNAISYELITKTETVTVAEEKIEIKKTAENFIFLADTSSSMGSTYKKTGKKKIVLQKEILKSRNADFPALSYNGGLYSHTPGVKVLTKQALTPFYEVKAYDKAAFAEAIEKLPTDASGTTPLQKGLEELDPILSGLKGHTVVFVMTDGSFTNWESLEKPIEIAKKLASKYDVSFYAIDFSDNPNNPQLRQAISSINSRSRVINFDEFLENPLFLSGALFVIEKSIVKKSVDIEKVMGAKLDSLLFAHDSAEINPQYADKLNKLGEYLQKNPTARLALSAFTDNNGPTEYNIDLSHRRVESVAAYLEKNFKIARERMALNFYGEANPVADNKTDEGRAKNRRIEGFVWL